MPLTQIDNGELADADVLMRNFKYLDQRITKSYDDYAEFQENTTSELEGFQEGMESTLETFQENIDSGLNPVVTTKGACPLDDAGTYTDEIYGEITKYKYNNTTILYSKVGSQLTNLPYTACNEYWVRKTYNNVSKDHIIKVECGGYIYLNVAHNNRSSSFTITLPNDIDDTKCTVKTSVSFAYEEDGYSIIMDDSDTTSTTANIGMPYNIQFSHLARFQTNDYAGTTLSFYIPSSSPLATLSYNCMLNWSVTQEKIPTENEQES